MKQVFEISVTHRDRPATQELVEVEIDLARLAQERGREAFYNKSGRSIMAGGIIKFSNVSKLRRIK